MTELLWPHSSLYWTYGVYIYKEKHVDTAYSAAALKAIEQKAWQYVSPPYTANLAVFCDVTVVQF